MQEKYLGEIAERFPVPVAADPAAARRRSRVWRCWPSWASRFTSQKPYQPDNLPNQTAGRDGNITRPAARVEVVHE